jgi:DivIVA domain-containing protein
MDRESIERGDFPLVRRGYDPAAVDAHLRAVVAAAGELAQHAASMGEPSLGSAAATRVQGILEAAQNTAGEIEREAQRDAQRTREEAAGELERARAHVETLARAAAALLTQVQSLDGEVAMLAQSLHAEGEGASSKDAPQLGGLVAEERELSLPASVSVAEERELSAPASVPVAEEPPAAEREREAVPQRSEDLDGARLVALNMALSGESREQTDRFLANSFQLSDRAKLLDEVYAAVEG